MMIVIIWGLFTFLLFNSVDFESHVALIEVKITILMIIILNIILIFALMYSIELFQGYFVIHNLIAIIFLLNEFPF